MKNNIREARKAAKMTQKELGARIGVSESAISQYESGNRQPDNTALLMMAEELGVSVGYLLGAETKKAPSGDEALSEYLDDLRERPETRALLEASRGMTKEQVEQMAAFAKILRGGG